MLTTQTTTDTKSNASEIDFHTADTLEAEEKYLEAEEKYLPWWAKQEFDDDPLPDSCDCGRIYNCYEPKPCCCTQEMKERKKVCGSCHMTQSRSCHRNCASESGGRDAGESDATESGRRYAGTSTYLDRHPVDFDFRQEEEEYVQAPLMNLADMDLFMTIRTYNAAEAAAAAKKDGDTDGDTP